MVRACIGGEARVCPRRGMLAALAGCLMEKRRGSLSPLRRHLAAR